MLYFARHGESEANIEKVFSNKGFKHPLTLNGINQALNAAALLQDKNIHRIVTSPLVRTIQTANILADKLNIASFEVHKNLREYDVGDLEGKSDAHSWSLYFENENSWKNIDQRQYKLPNGESFFDIQNRFISFITRLLTELTPESQNVLMISHGGLLKIGLPAICVNIDYAFTCNNPIHNCELIACDIIGNKIKCLHWGNTVFS